MSELTKLLRETSEIMDKECATLSEMAAQRVPAHVMLPAARRACAASLLEAYLKILLGIETRHHEQES